MWGGGRERGEIEEREGLSMTPTLKVWVSIVLVSSHHVGVKNSSRAQWSSFSEKSQQIGHNLAIPATKSD